ncbi:MAG: class I SAM-dependent methyltransferase, partial [Vicinamibacteria bacterium]|nr:class I SAM-dependent methyltransferase [Vicinamibacteria bacterium]
MRTIDNNAIAAAAAIRFRSEYDYALFEYLRSAKVIEALERAGVKLHGRILDDGCGGGGTVLSLAEEARFAIGLDLKPRFRDAGTRLARERAIGNAAFVCGDGTRLPLRAGTFDLVFSHSVIEHVSSAEEYLRECHRVLRPQGILYLSTAPYLSFAGAHLPRLRIPIPIHILFGRRVAFRTFCLLGRHASWLLKEARDSNTFVALAEQNEKKHDDLAQRVT